MTIVHQSQWPPKQPERLNLKALAPMPRQAGPAGGWQQKACTFCFTSTVYLLLNALIVKYHQTNGRAVMKTIDYSALMMRSTLGVIKDLLQDVAREGLPGEHHFFIDFDTTHPDVELSDTLRNQYPEEITIIIQNWFENMNVTEKALEITLNFSNTKEPMVVPWGAIRRFADPSVDFALQFELSKEDTPPPEDTKTSPGDGDKKTSKKSMGEVIQLDKFRKT